jgi:hypothetical protein
MTSFSVLYIKDKLTVQWELYDAVDMRFFDALDAIINSQEWRYQNRPIPREMLRALCPRDPSMHQSICAFCPNERFGQAGRALEHIQQHFGLRPFQCSEPNW